MSLQSKAKGKGKDKGKRLKAKIYQADKAHARAITKTARAIQQDFDRKAEELIQIVASVPPTNNLADEAFTFARNRAVALRTAKIIADLCNRTTNRILGTMEEAEALSLDKFESILQTYQVQDKASSFASRLSPEYKRELSNRVWSIGEQFGKEVEMAIDTALFNGTDAKNLSREVRALLREPHKLFRRVRNERGELVLSKSAKAYHPGQGVYRSSYKNALRLASTEINISYRSADYERWNSIDFIQGIEIDLSNNHPMYDICDELRGKYPKDFKFVGWHPHCRCIATPILPDPDHFERYLRRETDNPQDEGGQIDEMPQEFKEWEKKNALRIARAEEKGKLPYFLRDNPHRRSVTFKAPKGEQKMHIKNEETERKPKIQLTPEQKAYRKALQNEAREKFQGLEVSTEIGKIRITTTGIKEFLNQPHEMYFQKNELVKDLPKLIKEAEYIGYSDYHKENRSKIKFSHIFKINKKGWDNQWLIMRENEANEISLYGISGSSNVLKGLKKNNP